MEDKKHTNIELVKQILNKIDSLNEKFDTLYNGMDNIIEKNNQISNMFTENTKKMHKRFDCIEKKLDSIPNNLDNAVDEIFTSNKKNNINEEKLKKVITDVELLKRIIIKK